MPGTEIHKITFAGGRLHLAYGDYGGNTGPIHALALDVTDPLTVIDEATFTTEQTWNYRDLPSGLYAPFLDPQGGIGNPENGGYAVKRAGTWTVGTAMSPYPVHVADMAETTDGLWAVGASQVGDPGTTAGQIWHSTDDGATWASSLAIPSEGAESARFYALMAFGDDLIAVLNDPAATVDNRTWHRPAGGAWTEISDSRPVSDAVPFTYQGTPYFLCIDYGKSYGYSVFVDFHARTLPADESVQATIQAGFPTTGAGVGLDATVTADGLHLYLLLGNTVWRCDTAGVWTDLALDLTGTSARSLALDESGGWIYFGTTDSKVFRRVPA